MQSNYIILSTKLQQAWKKFEFKNISEFASGHVTQGAATRCLYHVFEKKSIDFKKKM